MESTPPKTPKGPKQRSYAGYALVDEGSGEVIPIHGEITVDLPVRPSRKHSRKDRDHMRWALLDLERISQLEITANESRVFWTISARVNPDDNIAKIRVKEIAEITGILPPHVSRALTELERRQVIFRIGSGIWRVNAWISYRGSVQAWEDATDDDPQPIWTRS